MALFYKTLNLLLKHCQLISLLGKIFHTLITRSATLLFNFLIVLGISRVLGTDGKGESTLIITSIYLIVFLANMAGGKAIIYLAPRYSSLQLLFQNYVGIAISILMAWLFLENTEFIDASKTPHILLLSLTAGITDANASLVAGRKEIKKYNAIQVLQITITLVGLTLGFYFFEQKNLMSYIVALYIAYGVTLVLSFYWAYKKVKLNLQQVNLTKIKSSLSKSFEYQIADLFLLLVYRSNFYLLLYYHGAGSLGLFSVGVSILEVAWLAGRSISFIQFSEISNFYEQTDAARLSTSLIKASLFSSGIFLLIVLLLPDSFYAFLFGYAFEPITEYMKWLVPGIWIHNIHLISSHFFAGRGKNLINILISLSGLICTFTAGIILIPNYAISGAGFANTAGFSLMSFMATWVFLKQNKLDIKTLLPTMKDYKMLKVVFKNHFNKAKKQI